MNIALDTIVIYSYKCGGEMNKESLKIIRELMIVNNLSQREISHKCNISLGKTNKLLHSLIEEGYLTEKKVNGYDLTDKGITAVEPYQVDNAIIMAAGFGSRFVPLTYETPKGLLEVYGERMLERQIEQLLEVGITDITIVVGYLKEKFEYLIDKYGVELVYNPDYDTKNNISSIYHVRHLLRNSYILCSDNYMTENLFHTYEFESWYSTVKSEGQTDEWCLFTDKKGQINRIEVGGSDEWHMYGPVFFSKEFSETFIPLLEETYNEPRSDNFYWEDVLKENLDRLEMYVNRQLPTTVYEFENLEELRDFDFSYRDQSRSEIMSLIAFIFQIKENEIKDIKPLKLGMTNKSFLFSLKDKKYICRLPGEGTDKLINRNEEFESIQAVVPLNITENIVYIDPKSGIKISEFERGARSVDITNEAEVSKCLSILRNLHNSDIQVPHHFNLEKNILFYEEICRENDAILFEDYSMVRTKMSELLSLIKNMDIPIKFSHVDAHFDNFLVLPNGEFKLIDWEYAGMCDPLIDLSMFALYGTLDSDQVEELMRQYFETDPTEDERLRVFIYMALGGFVWSLWAQYKQAQGVKFGDYTINMYRYAKQYYEKSMALMRGEKESEVTAK
jgi:CTP:phosphocholine cytidylyltransferase-like protein/thiamine kinase-like enzyme/predicted transcriptional regulator